MHHPVEKYLNTGNAAASVLAHGWQVLQAQRAYQEFAPAFLGQGSTVANIKQGIVVIHAESGAIAAKLSQMTRSLAGEFAKRGFECSEVKVKVQGRITTPLSPPPQVHPISQSAGSQLTDLAHGLPEQSSLRRALEELVQRAAIKA